MLQSAPPHLRHFIVHLENTMWCTSTPKDRRSLHGCRRCLGKELLLPSMALIGSAKDRKAIAITPCAAEHPMSFKDPCRLLTDGQCRMMINGIQFIQVLLEANGLAAGKDHQFKGRYDAEKNAVIISLEKDEQSALSPQKCTT